MTLFFSGKGAIMNINNLTIEELEDLYDLIPDRIEELKTAEQNGDWDNVVNALKNYFIKHGNIIVCGEELFIDDLYDVFGIPGHITIDI
jgi:stalled ribosome rescue protein Dom34